MSQPPLLLDEQARLSALRRYRVLDTSPEEAFDELVHIGALVCRVPICLISLVDSARQWFKARKGLDVDELPRESAFCAHAIAGKEILVVPDTQADTRFVDNPLVADFPHIRFYAGASIVTPDGFGLGTVCVIDRAPRMIGPSESRALRGLARAVMTQLELRRTLLSVDERTRELDAFTSSVSHDLRAPLRAMRGFMEILREDHAGKPLEGQAVELIDRALAASGRMEALISGLLQYARISREELVLQRVPLRPILEEVVAELGEELRSRKGVIQLPPEPPAVRAHPQALRQILSNLLSNAVKFVPPEVLPRVNVSAESSEDRVVLGVEDNGVGIPPDARERLFRPFSRPVGMARDVPGVGMGLAIVRKNVERMNGRFGVESTPGQGSRFWIELPLDAPGPYSP